MELEHWGLLRVVLYADDLVLLSSDAAGLQALLDATQAFCATTGLQVNVSKTEAVVCGASRWQPARGTAPWCYAGGVLPVSLAFKYLGIVLHSTRGMSAAVDRLRGAGLRAVWGMHSRCTQYGITDFALRTRLLCAYVRVCVYV